MPYRTSTAPVKERQLELDAIVAKGAVSFKTNNPAALRYKLHEALYAARIHGIEPYSSLNVRIRTRPPYIHVLPNGPALEVEVSDLEEVAEDCQIYDDVTALAVLARARVNPDHKELHFPSFNDKIAPIERWASKNNYTVELNDELKILILKRQI